MMLGVIVAIGRWPVRPECHCRGGGERTACKPEIAHEWGASRQGDGVGEELGEWTGHRQLLTATVGNTAAAEQYVPSALWDGSLVPVTAQVASYILLPVPCVCSVGASVGRHAAGVARVATLDRRAIGGQFRPQLTSILDPPAGAVAWAAHRGSRWTGSGRRKRV